MVTGETSRRTGQGGEAGFALILAMLCLMVLTFLGMALATTTSTELLIATNYRWSQQAYYNAEAGVELGKRFLRQFEVREMVGDPREAFPTNEMGTPPTDWLLARPGADGEPSRNYENQLCDDGGAGELGSGVGYGNIFDHPSFAAPFQNTSVFFGQQLNGTFTLWIRRSVELIANPADADDRQYQDSRTRVILTAEGTAPYLGSQQVANRAVRYLTVEVERPDQSQCGDYDQGGASATGSGGSCAGGTLNDDALAGYGAAGEAQPSIE